MLLQKKKHLLALFTIFKTSSLAYGSFKEGDTDLLPKHKQNGSWSSENGTLLVFLIFWETKIEIDATDVILLSEVFDHLKVGCLA